VNEELYTVNTEHQEKIRQLIEVTTDLENLLESTEIATVFLDRELRIRRFTPAICHVIDLMGPDVGRPISHLTHRLQGLDLSSLANDVLAAPRKLQMEVSSTDGHPLLLSILPYHRRDGEVDGVILNLVSLAEIKGKEQSLAESQERFREVAERTNDLFSIGSLDGPDLEYVSPGYEALWGQSASRLRSDPKAWLEPVVPEDRDLVDEDAGQSLADHEVSFRIRDPEGKIRWIDSRRCVVRDDSGEPKRIITMARDISALKVREQELRQQSMHLAAQLYGPHAEESAMKGHHHRAQSRLPRASELWAAAQGIRSLARREVVAHELLIRGPKGAYRDPGDLFLLAMEARVLESIDLAAFRTCLEAAERLELRRFHVNLFPITLVEVGGAKILELLEPSALAPRLCLEISARQVSGAVARLARELEPLQAAGVRLALDDFSAGPEEQEVLAALTPELVKITAPPVESDGADQDYRLADFQELVGAATVGSTRVVAKGLVSRRQLELVRGAGIDLVQGFLFDTPVPAADLAQGVTAPPSQEGAMDCA
jgi:PAS domain S-box-containing protein